MGCATVIAHHTEGTPLKKSEKDAREKLRKHPINLAGENVIVVKRKGGHIEPQQGQAVKQKFGSGLLDVIDAARKAKGKK